MVDFHVFENSGPSREVYVDFGLVTTVNEGSTEFLVGIFSGWTPKIFSSQSKVVMDERQIVNRGDIVEEYRRRFSLTAQA